MRLVSVRIGTVALWIMAAVVSGGLAIVRYRSAVTAPVGGDFRIYVHSAQLLAAGRSPYQASPGYVYPPIIAGVLAPFSHAGIVHLWKAWTAAEVVALVAGAGWFVAAVANRMASWLAPILFAFCSITVLHFWPVTLGLSLGQSDAFVFAALAMSTWAATRPRSALRGVLLGVAGLLKAWPAAAGASLGQRGLVHRSRAVIGFGITLALAPLLALVFGGGSGLRSFFGNVLAARSQPLVTDSVWGAPTLLFSHSGLARPIAESSVLHTLVALVLFVGVAGLVVLVLRTTGSPVLCTWNVVFCVVLLLPVSHRAYALYGVPLLWAWVAESLCAERVDRRHVAVVAVLGVWWLIQTKAWPDSGSSPSISSIRFVIPFAANLMACAASVIGAWLLSRSPAVIDQTNGAVEPAVDHRDADTRAGGRVPLGIA